MKELIRGGRNALPFVAGNRKPAQHDQLKRSRWRVLLMIIRAKLESVEAGISTIEEQFLADIVTPQGSTVYQWFRPQLQAMLASGRAPTRLIESAVSTGGRDG